MRSQNEGNGMPMLKYEFWCRLRGLERKYDRRLHSPVRRRLERIDEWASSIMDGWAVTDGVPRWLCNELLHVEDGREFGNGVIGASRELPPVYADMMFHGVLSDIPWGGTVLPSNFVFGKDSAKDGRAQNGGRNDGR